MTNETISDQMLRSAALISATHNRANPRYFDARFHHSGVPAIWGSRKVKAGPPFEPRRHAQVTDAEATHWLAMCSALTGAARDGQDAFLRKGWTNVCRLTGLSWGLVTAAVNDVRYFGAAAAGAAWSLYMRHPDERCVGEIYVAHVVGQPSIVKVGFTTQIDKRMTALSRAEGSRVVAERVVPGTLLHEWALHAQIPGAIKPEWYPRENLPSWLLGGAF